MSSELLREDSNVHVDEGQVESTSQRQISVVDSATKDEQIENLDLHSVMEKCPDVCTLIDRPNDVAESETETRVHVIREVAQVGTKSDSNAYVHGDDVLIDNGASRRECPLAERVGHRPERICAVGEGGSARISNRESEGKPSPLRDEAQIEPDTVAVK